MNMRVAAALAFGVAGVAVLLNLGAWQVSRMHWKEALIDGMESRMATNPVPLPVSPDPKTDEFLRVQVAGAFTDDAAIRFLTSQKPWGPGHKLIAKFETEAGRLILVDRGFLAEGETAAPPLGPQQFNGVMRWPNETGSFTPEPDPDQMLWFGRDVVALAKALGTEPVMVVAETAPGAWPKPLPEAVNFPNDHLQYAITWFSLAAIWTVMTVFLVRRERQRTA